MSDHPVLREPSGGVPEVVTSDAGLAEVVARLRAGTGPFAMDAERASGHRYGQRAFLIQIRREGTGTVLVDPVGLGDTTPLAEVLRSDEWILHAATQDLPCLAELELRPSALFDTELAGRLLGLPRVGLASLTEDLLGVGLAKGHGAADWSKRPLPRGWLSYAALDVELLADLRVVLTERLDAAGRMEWARQEFAALVHFSPRQRPDPWRRTSGTNRLSDPRDLAVVRELWLARDDLAWSVDRPPGRVLPDAAIVAAVRARPASLAALLDLPEFATQKRNVRRWWDAIENARDLPADELPDLVSHDGPPPPKAWARRNPLAAARLSKVRAAVTAHADDLAVPTEVLISPDPVRVLVWETAGELRVSAAEIRERLAAAGARPWQVAEVADRIAAALADAESPEAE